MGRLPPRSTERSSAADLEPSSTRSMSSRASRSCAAGREERATRIRRRREGDKKAMRRRREGDEEAMRRRSEGAWHSWPATCVTSSASRASQASSEATEKRCRRRAPRAAAPPTDCGAASC